jgi:hypothetical protein
MSLIGTVTVAYAGWKLWGLIVDLWEQELLDLIPENTQFHQSLPRGDFLSLLYAWVEWVAPISACTVAASAVVRYLLEKRGPGSS